MPSDEQSTEKWKQKYYDQLDQLEARESDWRALETTLKHTISRISLAAEGQNSQLDRHLNDLRTHLKSNIERTRLESIVDNISRILSQLEESQSQPERASIAVLEQLISALDLEHNVDKPLKKLLKQFKQANDTQYDALLKDSIALLKAAISPQTTPAKPGFLRRLFHTEQNRASGNATAEEPLFTDTLAHLLSLIPWPDNLASKAASTIEAIQQCTSDKSFDAALQQLEQILKQWPAITPDKQKTSKDLDNQPLDTYKSCLIELLNTLDNPQSPSGKLTALKISIRDAQSKQQLTKLTTELPQLLIEKSADISPIDKTPALTDTSSTDAESLTGVHIETETVTEQLQPTIQELLIRLLEHLIVPVDLQHDVDQIKHRLTQETQACDWKILLKDVAALINSIRSTLQKEKHEFEHFLQQVTDRLKIMDQFLQTETSNLQQAETQGGDFDQQIHDNVDEIRRDVSDATELSSLKQTVSNRLDTISEHIQHYRSIENQRVQQSREQVSEMHSRLQTLENETSKLKKEVIKKNRQAMVDTLTAIPNRLSYEKKIEEEISRWKRFKTPLSLVIWDIDFFKKVNDSYGHKAGDKVLKTIAQLLYKRIRSTDFLARYGGEEFVML
ncbi:diguanylate cyclase (GGDEF domain), partial [hydrothermal vent metagenome]